jgi:hypothetical protein
MATKREINLNKRTRQENVQLLKRRDNLPHKCPFLKFSVEKVGSWNSCGGAGRGGGNGGGRRRGGGVMAAAAVVVVGWWWYFSTSLFSFPVGS